MQSDAVRELVVAVESLEAHMLALEPPFNRLWDTQEFHRLRKARLAVKAEEKPQAHKFVPAEFGRRDICQHHTYGYFVCGEPADAPIHQKAGK